MARVSNWLLVVVAIVVVVGGVTLFGFPPGMDRGEVVVGVLWWWMGLVGIKYTIRFVVWLLRRLGVIMPPGPTPGRS